MSGIYNSVADFAQWLFLTSIKSTVIVALIMIIRLIFRDRLSAQWRHTLWFLLIIRLILPFDLPSDISIYNLAPKVQYRPAPSKSVTWMNALTTPVSSTAPKTSDASASLSAQKVVEREEPLSPITLSHIVILIWSSVAIIILFYALLINLNLRLNLKKSKLILDKRIVEILESCKKRINVNIPIFVYATSGIDSPFWYGFLRPRIFLPVHLLDSFSEKNLEHIFLHELAHYKRFDLQVALLQTILQSLYWFNPFVWYSFWKMRADRELACDELVLKVLGNEESESYGHTLVSLLKSVKHNRLVPVTIGLSDDHHNLKRRVNMIANFTKKPVIWSIIGLVVFVLTASTALTSAKVGNVHATITVRGTQPSEYYVGIFNPRMDDDLRVAMGEPLDYQKINENEVTFNVEPGRYAIAAWAFGYEYTYQNFIVPDNKTEFHFDIELAPKGLPETFTKVLLIGDFCAWEVDDAWPMEKDGDVWRIKPFKGMRMGSQYKFILDIPGPHAPGWVPYLYRYSPAIPSAEVALDYTTFNHIRDTEEIVFDPGVFVTPMEKGKVTIKGGKTEQQYADFMDDFLQFQKNQRNVQESLPKEDPEKWYQERKHDYTSFAQDYPTPLQSIVFEEWLVRYSWHHPFFIHLRELAQSGADSTELRSYFSSQDFIDYVTEMDTQFKYIDMKSPLFNGDIANVLLALDRYIREASADTQEKLPVKAGYYEKMLLDFSKAKKYAASENILYSIISQYVQLSKKEPKYTKKARDLIERIRQDHPDGLYVKNVIDKLENELNLAIGANAPDFEVETLSGQTFKLSDRRGRFVFIDFWGSWCGPCRSETPNILKLVHSISTDTLVVIGLANDNEKALTTYIKEANIIYENALLPEEIEDSYGISAFPTTYLIAPDGSIIGKDLRGSTLVEQVRQSIDTFN